MSHKQGDAQRLALSEVFNPGQFPRYTYRPREASEEAIKKWWGDRGKILIVNGPSKTGKTVLVRKLLDDYNPILIEGHGLDSTEVLWTRIADKLNLFTNITHDAGEGEERSTTTSIQLGASGSHVASRPTNKTSSDKGASWSVSRPIEEVARDALLQTNRPLVIDDIHFVPREAQEQIIKALKPLVFGSQSSPGLRVVFISIGNRVINVLTSLPDMRDRMLPLAVEYWTPADLARIADDGFVQLHLVDSDGSIAKTLAEQSFGSPQLMQQLCRELCYSTPNDVREAALEPVGIEPPLDWREFFEAQLLADIGSWVTKLAKGPEQRGSARKLLPLKRGGEVDAYQALLLAVAQTGPALSLSKDELRIAFGNILNVQPPPKSVPTWVLSNMSLIAATKLLDKLPPLTTLKRALEEGFDPYAQADVQPVLEYRDSGATSELVITDPFFAFYLAWGLDKALLAINAPTVEATTREAESEDETTELEEWGEPS